ncbi:MAG: hypothetical protein IK990_19055 [Ruminiclostridium sp.]|nr:hypothetical protein [Ruminiclostridium sp.]
MTEIEIMRSRRRENTSAEAFSYVSQYRDMPMTKHEIHIKAVSLEAEMLYLEGYISVEELFAKIVSAYQESDEGLICHNCGKSLSFLLWNDIAVYEDMVRYIVLPLPVNNVVGHFKNQRQEAVKNGEKGYRSYLLKEISSSNKSIELMKMGFEMRGEQLKIGLSCPYCKQMLDYSRVYTRLNDRRKAS